MRDTVYRAAATKINLQRVLKDYFSEDECNGLAEQAISGKDSMGRDTLLTWMTGVALDQEDQWYLNGISVEVNDIVDRLRTLVKTPTPSTASSRRPSYTDHVFPQLFEL
jgi:hypothetical protein